MPVLLLIRHGQASFGAQDYDRLSPLGCRQSQHVGAELAARRLRDPVAVCGTLRRQRDTASIALSHAGRGGDAADPSRAAPEPRVDGRWDEYDHLDLLKRYVNPPTGDASEHAGGPPMSSREVQRLLDSALLSWVEHGDEGGWPAFSGGANAALTDLAGSLAKGQDAVVFTSGGVVAAVCARLLGLPASGVVALNRVAVNGGITKVVVGSSGASLVSFNDHAHLERDGSVTYR